MTIEPRGPTVSASPVPVDRRAVTAHLAFLGDPAFLAALALALPAFLAFAFAPGYGIPIRVPASPLLFVLVYPVLEEIVFRGLVLGRLLQVPALAVPRLGIVTGANVCTALLFAFAHLLREPWPWALATFLPGLLFGWLRERHGGVAAPALLHVAYNAAVLAAVWAAPYAATLAFAATFDALGWPPWLAARAADIGVVVALSPSLRG